MDRPKIKLTRTRWENSFDLIAVIAVLLSLYVVYVNYASLPESIPRHFGFDGTPDAYGGKSGILLLPLVGLFLFVSMALVSCIPHLFNYPCRITIENAERQYILARQFLAVLRAEITCLFAFLTWRTIQVANGEAGGLGGLFLPMTLAIIAASIVIYVVRARRER